MNPLPSDRVNEILGAAGPGAAVFLVGIGGCGMSGLAHLLLDLGFAVAGSDLAANEEIRQMRERGAAVQIGHSANQVHAAAPVLLAYSSAVRSDNPELAEARSLGVPIVRRAVLLAALLSRQSGVCVSGMHGKTTTTALLAWALEQLGQRPSYAVGALVPQLERHARFSVPVPGLAADWKSTTPYFVIEADESDGSLREFYPRHAIVLNVDAEHLDFYANIEAVCQEFERFTAKIPGWLIFCADDARLAEMNSRRPGAISYGFHALAGYRCEAVPNPSGREAIESGSRFRVWYRGAVLGEFQLRLIGPKNISNATAVVAFLHQAGFASGEIARSLAGFAGAARRQQEIHCSADYRVFEDYGHHPAEIRATLAAFRQFRPARLLVAFQPHRYSRTRSLITEFAAAFGDADQLWITDVYSAGEPEVPGVNGQYLTQVVGVRQPTAQYSPAAALPARVLAAAKPGDWIVFLGAGADIGAAGRRFCELLAADPKISETTLLPKKDAPMNAPDRLSQNFTELQASLSPDTVLRREEPLAKRTTLRVGGAADIYVEPASEAELATVLRFCSSRGLPFVMLGRGSNLLIRDGGIRGVVISLAHPSFSRVELRGESLVCGAGARLKAVSVEARRHGLAGLEFLEGIPGSVGGAMRMNAGAMGSWMFDVVETIRFMDYAGNVVQRRASEVNVEYRGCPLLKNHIALEAVVKGVSTPPEVIRERMDTYSKKRWESQPNQPSAGCIFKNPTTIPAGRLIDELGLKGTSVGGAMVSDVHANFIVNTGAATAGDVLQLIDVIKLRARSTRGIELETEVEILGEAPAAASTVPSTPVPAHE